MFELPPLPYAYDALEPFISEETLRLHHDVLHRRYVNNLNRLVGTTPWSLEWLIQSSPSGSEILRNALQVWNHDFLWKSMRAPWPPSETYRGVGNWDLSRNLDGLVERGREVFGSGYLWLLREPMTGQVVSWISANGDNPIRLMPSYKPLLTIDVWEHAYLLDYGGRRRDYVRAFLSDLANWEFAQANYATP